MFIPHDEVEAYTARLDRGLKALGSNFLASLCWWCKGTTRHNFEHCDICGKHGYGSATGLLVCNEPAPASVVNQVLVAGWIDFEGSTK